MNAAEARSMTEDRPYGVLQAELSSRCTLRCVTCLRGNFPEQWIDADMPPEICNAMLDAAERFSAVHVQGWGESLMRGDVPDRVAQLKARGVLVSLSTNGVLLSREGARELVAAGVDSMAVSLAGADAATQDPLRGEGTFAAATQAIRDIAAARGRGTSPPLLVNLLITPRTLADLPRAVRLCAELGADRVVCTNMVHVCCSAQQRLVAYDRGRQWWPVALARWAAIVSHVELAAPHLRTEELPVCPKNPLENAYLAADGTVSPCVYLCPPMRGAYPRLTPAGWGEAERVGFGSLATSSFSEIWDAPDYVAFREAFSRRTALYDALTAHIGTDFDSAARLAEVAHALRTAFATTHQPPPPCRGCPHLCGV